MKSFFNFSDRRQGVSAIDQIERVAIGVVSYEICRLAIVFDRCLIEFSAVFMI